MITDYRQKHLRNQIKQMIGRYKDEELEVFVKQLQHYLHGNNDYQWTVNTNITQTPMS